MFKAENVHPNYLKLIQINNKSIFQLDFLRNMTTRAKTGITSNDHKYDENSRNQPMITAEKFAQESQQKIGAAFQPQTQTTSVISNPIMNNTEATEGRTHTRVSEISPLSGFPLRPAVEISLPVPKKRFEFYLMLIVIQKHLKNLHLRKIFLRQTLINSSFKTLQR